MSVAIGTTSIRRFNIKQIQFSSILLRTASVLYCLLFWFLAVKYHLNLGFITFANVPSPHDVISAAWDLLHSPKLWSHVSSSVYRVLAGFTVAGLLGVGLGLIIGRSKFAANTLLPPLEILRPIPAVAWIPLAILMFPSGEFSMIFITFTGAIFPILLNTIHGVEGVDARLIASARSLGGTRFAIFREVIFPAAAPNIITGLSIGMGTCWFCLVTAEMISGQFGIGYYTWESYTLQNYPNIVVGMLMIGILGMGSSVLIKKIGHWLTPWYQPNKKQA